MSQKGPAALEPSGRGQPTHKNSAKIAIFAVVQKTLKMRTYREIFDGMLRAAALMMIMAMVAGACGKNDEPAGPDNNTEQPSKLETVIIPSRRPGRTETVPAVREALEMMVAMKGITVPEMARELAMKVGNPEMVVVTAMATREASRIRK